MFIEDIIAVLDDDQLVQISTFNHDRESNRHVILSMRADVVTIQRRNYWEVFRIYQGAGILHVCVARISDEY